MARYQPIETADDLPQSASARENLVLDFKSTVSVKAWWELAKDVAAFANHVGGTLLIGASEKSPDGVHYNGLAPDEAERIGRAYEDVVKEHCLPRPIVRVVPISLPDGKRVVAINVEPFPDQPVGSRVPTLNKNDQPEASNGYQFPVRVGRDTRALTPDQLPLMTNPMVRRNVILLERVSERGGDGKAMLVWRHPSNATAYVPTITSISDIKVDAFANVFSMALEGETAPVVEVPLDDVEAVRQTAGRWHIRVRGFLESGRSYFSNPRTPWLRGY